MSGIWVTDLLDLPYPWRIYVHLFWARHSADAWHLTEVQRIMVESALARGDETTAASYVEDFSYWNRYHRVKPELRIKMFVPGQHYHVLGEVFDTYDAARDHAKRAGYKVLGLNKVVVPLDGD